MYCRKTKLILMYYIKNRKTENLYPKFKKHIEPGTVLITDEHASYMSTLSMKSRLSTMGYYHFYINHNAVR